MFIPKALDPTDFPLYVHHKFLVYFVMLIEKKRACYFAIGIVMFCLSVQLIQVVGLTSFESESLTQI